MSEYNDRTYPNLSALAQGGVSGKLSSWPYIKPEMQKALNELDRLRKSVEVENSALKKTQEACDVLARERDALSAENGRLRHEFNWLRKENEQIREHATKLGTRIAELQHESDELRKALEDAPHGCGCNSAFGRTFPCNCWKSHAPDPQRL